MLYVCLKKIAEEENWIVPSTELGVGNSKLLFRVIGRIS